MPDALPFVRGFVEGGKQKYTYCNFIYHSRRNAEMLIILLLVVEGGIVDGAVDKITHSF